MTWDLGQPKTQPFRAWWLGTSGVYHVFAMRLRIFFNFFFGGFRLLLGDDLGLGLSNHCQLPCLEWSKADKHQVFFSSRYISKHFKWWLGSRVSQWPMQKRMKSNSAHDLGVFCCHGGSPVWSPALLWHPPGTPLPPKTGGTLARAPIGGYLISKVSGHMLR